MKRCGAYQKNGHCRIHSTNTTVSGIPRISVPGYDVDLTSDITVATTLRICLANCRTGYPDLTDFKSDSNGMLDDYGVTSWKEFVKNRKSITIDLLDDILVFRPKSNQGIHGGYAGIPELILRLPADSSPEQIGQAFRECFDNSD